MYLAWSDEKPSRQRGDDISAQGIALRASCSVAFSLRRPIVQSRGGAKHTISPWQIARQTRDDGDSRTSESPSETASYDDARLVARCTAANALSAPRATASFPSRISRPIWVPSTSLSGRTRFRIRTAVPRASNGIGSAPLHCAADDGTWNVLSVPGHGVPRLSRRSV